MSTPQASSPGINPITVSVKQAAQMLGLSTAHTYRLLEDGKVESRYSGRRRLVLVDSLHKYVDSLPHTAA